MNTPLRLAVAGLFMAGAALAAEEGGHFAMMKKQMLADIDAELGMMQKFRDCIAAANDPEGLKACHHQREAAMREKHRSMKAQRVREIEEQQKRLDEEKQKLQKDDDQPQHPDQK